MGRLMAITSGKGGVGKSSISVGLATTLGKMGHSVLLVDLDAGMRCLDLMLDLSDRLLFDLGDVLRGEKTVEEALLSDPSRPGVFFLGAPLKGAVVPEQFRRFVRETTAHFDFVLLDFPAGGVDELYAALPRYTEALVVCNADAVSLRDAAIIGQDLNRLEFMSVRLVLNRVSFDTMRKGLTANIDEVIDRSGIRLIGVIPQSMELYLSCCSGASLPPKCRAAKAFDRLAKRLLGYDISLRSYKKI